MFAEGAFVSNSKWTSFFGDFTSLEASMVLHFWFFQCVLEVNWKFYSFQCVLMC